MGGIMHLNEIGRVNWPVRRRNKFVLVVSVDLRASQMFGEEKRFCSFYLEALVSEEAIAGILQMISFKEIF